MDARDCLAMEVESFGEDKPALSGDYSAIHEQKGG